MSPPPSGGVLVTGASGFVGASVIGLLAAADIPVIALARRSLPPANGRIHWFQGDLFDPVLLDQAMDGASAVIHLVGIIRQRPSHGVTFHRIHVEGTRAVLDAARRSGVKKIIHMSALGARPDAAGAYHQTKFAAEQLVQQSDVNWTIFRPSLIHGPGGEFMDMEFAWARGKAAPYFFMPYFGSGILGRAAPAKIQPVFVADVARAFVDALDNPKSSRQIYPLGGADQLTWPQMHRIVAQAVVGKTRPVIPIPAWYAKILTYIVPPQLLPFNRAQVIMSQEDNTCDMAKFTGDFGWSTESFSASLARYVHGNKESRK